MSHVPSGNGSLINYNPIAVCSVQNYLTRIIQKLIGNDLNVSCEPASWVRDSCPAW